MKPRSNTTVRNPEAVLILQTSFYLFQYKKVVEYINEF